MSQIEVTIWCPLYVLIFRFCSGVAPRSHRPINVHLCELSRDCLLSQWAAWANWTALHPPPGSYTGSNAQLIRTRVEWSMQSHDPESHVVLSRSRSVLEVPRGAGQRCAHVVEQQRARVELGEADTEQCDRYQWLTGTWGACAMQGADAESGALCGLGMQNRTVLCVRREDSVPVADSLCAELTPPHTRHCDVSCPGACSVTSWGAWSECLPHRCRAHGLHLNGHRVRSRTAISAFSGGDCPHLQETQPCDFPPCFSWTPQGGTTVCQLHKPAWQCGNGTQALSYTCRDFTGAEVSRDHCPEALPPQIQPCHVPCPHDCVISEWLPWSPCSQTCQSHVNSGFRSRHRIQLAYHTRDGLHCPLDTRAYVEHESCTHLPVCTSHAWLPEPWSPCLPLRDQDGGVSGGAGCGAGVQRRAVHCASQPGGERAPNRKCEESLRPPTERNCTADCGAPCRVSHFTDWSPCPVTCATDGVAALQTRVRFVLDAPRPPGSLCPHLVERRDCPGLPRCVQYAWRVDEWSRCLLEDKCGDGFTVRDVECTAASGEALPEAFCIAELGSMPDVTQRCHVSCDVTPCSLSDWSVWSACSQYCAGGRARHRSFVGLPDSHDCYDESLYPLSEQSACPGCPRLASQPIGTWSSCILSGDLDHNTEVVTSAVGGQRSSSQMCGIGRRYHALMCADGQGHNTSAHVCHAQALAEELCLVACPVDCQLSEWGAWSECRLQVRCGPGTRTRYRYLIAEAAEGGRSCPPTVQNDEEYETANCWETCGRYEWRVSHWTPCVPQLQVHSGPMCGPGLQTLAVKCYQLPGDADTTEAVVLSDSECAHLPRPREHDSDCTVPCQGQCVVSHWQQWSQCPHDCSGERVRTREAIRPSDSRDPSPCPPLYETTPCVLNHNCYTYSLGWAEWGECAVGGAGCGAGEERSQPQCVRSEGALEAMYYCMSGEAQLQVRTRRCEIPCPQDCVVSEWGSWSDCNVTCGLGYSVRDRQVVLDARFGGRPCSGELRQSRPCHYTQCFRWEATQWGPCHIKADSCGFGQQSRQLRCVRHDDVIVDGGMCPEGGHSFYELEQACFRSCGGDCEVSDWSPWGLCHRSCVDGITEGLETRSRAVLNPASPTGRPCPSPLVETRPCWATSLHTCPFYTWRVSAWFGDHRQVWCERNDGLHVQGGCPESSRPVSVKSCSRPCLVQHSVCADMDVCACASGYTAISDTRTGRLLECVVPVSIPRSNISAGQSTHTGGSRLGAWLYTSCGVALLLAALTAAAICYIKRREARAHRGKSGGRSGRRAPTDRHVSPPLLPPRGRASDPELSLT